jgi:hypothetical protein
VTFTLTAVTLPVPACPSHDRPLSGGPVLYHCPHGQNGHGVTAADIAEARELVPA